ncbi:MAG TPA: hypothetical protein VKU36_00265 [Candidatus Babeliales bacterium]|nr:hypothetical protein [Candidatus Babeliales bacterium]
MQRLLAVSLACAVFPFYAMHLSPVKINDLSTCIGKEKDKKDIYSLLRYPTEEFKKTDILLIDGAIPEEGSFKQRVFQVEKQGTLDSLTPENVKRIADGQACYHYNIKKSHTESDLLVGAIAIDKQVHSSSKYDHDLKYERNAILAAALLRKIAKKQEIESALDETMYGCEETNLPGKF